MKGMTLLLSQAGAKFSGSINIFLIYVHVRNIVDIWMNINYMYASN